MAGKKILMICGDYCEDYETMVPFQALLAVGHQVHAVCPDKKAGEQIKTAIHDFEGAQTYSEKPGHNFTLNASFADVNPRTTTLWCCPAGAGLSTCAPTRPSSRRCSTSSRPTSPWPPSATPRSCWQARAYSGRSCSAYPACRAEVELAGGRYADIAVDKAHTDGNLVSAPAWPAHPDWIAQFLVVLGTRITH